MKVALELSSKKNREGLFEVYLRIQDGTSKKRVKANLALSKNQFKSKNNKFEWVRNHPNARALNSELRALLEKYNDVVLNSSVKSLAITPEALLHRVKKDNGSVSLVKFFKGKIADMLEYNQRKGYVQVLNNWEAYTEKEKLGDLEFKHIDVAILKGFENYLFKRGLKSSTVYGNLKRIRSCFNMAIKEQVIGVNDYVFRAYTMPKSQAAKKEKLSVEELKAFISQDYPSGSLSKNIQQAFMLSFYLAGVRIEDILTLTWTDVKKDRIEYAMAKTGAINSFQITPQIRAVLDYFSSIRKGKAKLILPLMEEEVVQLKESKVEKDNELYKREISIKTSLVNKYLKRIAEDAGIEKKVSSHIARHTFASIAIKKSNGDMYFVQNALKHSNPKITQIYLASLDHDSMDSKMESVTNLD